MTRRNTSIFTWGSLTRNIKRAVAIVALLTSSTEAASESHYNLRIHKNFIKETLDKNFRIVLREIESKVDKNVYLSDVNANIEKLDLRIQPKDKQNWNVLETDLFFDQGQIVMELNGLEFAGKGKIVDSESGTTEMITVAAELDLAQLVLSLDQEVNDDGTLYPKIEISEVAFTLHPEMFNINVKGKLPLYKSAAFEESIKKWMTSQIASREFDFREALQKAER